MIIVSIYLIPILKVLKKWVYFSLEFVQFEATKFDCTDSITDSVVLNQLKRQNLRSFSYFKFRSLKFEKQKKITKKRQGKQGTRCI